MTSGYLGNLFRENFPLGLFHSKKIVTVENLYLFFNLKHKHLVIDRFSNDCRKTKTKASTPTNHNRNEQRDGFTVMTAPRYNAPDTTPPNYKP